MTPQEAADMANVFMTVPPDNDRKIKGFISSETPRNIQKFIHLLYTQGHERYFNMAKTALDIQLAEDAEKTTRRLVWLTWAIVALTFALLAVEIRAVFFLKH